MSLSIPPVNSSLPASARHIAVMGKSVGMNVTASFVRVSQIYSYSQSVTLDRKQAGALTPI